MSAEHAPVAVTILGSTGSVGISTLNVIAAHPDRYRVFALAANRQVELLLKQCAEFEPEYAVLFDGGAAVELRRRLEREGLRTQVLDGAAGLETVAADERVDTVMAAIVGGIGLVPTLAAARAGKKVLLANKEALVMAGNLFMDAIQRANARLLPIDSEHNAIFQCLPMDGHARFVQHRANGFEKIVLTASGGPFLHVDPAELADVTPEQACNHPNWNMGPKISVDSATMANKALELIEASILFATPPAQIDILIHPQSIIHSMVHYADGSVLAQLGNPDMRTPIAYGLAWPERIAAGVRGLNLAGIGALSFEAPDERRFPCLRLGREAAEARGAAPIVFNAANECAVAAFLAGDLGYTRIPAVIEEALARHAPREVDTIAHILEEDRRARELADRIIREFRPG